MEMDEQEEKSPTARWRTSMVFVVMSNKMESDPEGKKREKKKKKKEEKKCGQESPELRVAMSEMFLPTRASFGSDFPHML